MAEWQIIRGETNFKFLSFKLYWSLGLPGNRIREIARIVMKHSIRPESGPLRALEFLD